MAVVRKCDICGEIYDEHPVGKTMIIANRTRASEYSVINENYLDCCPECTRKLSEFIDILKVNAPYVIYTPEDKEYVNHAYKEYLA